MSGEDFISLMEAKEKEKEEEEELKEARKKEREAKKKECEREKLAKEEAWKKASVIYLKIPEISLTY